MPEHFIVNVLTMTYNRDRLKVSAYKRSDVNMLSEKVCRKSRREGEIRKIDAGSAIS